MFGRKKKKGNTVTKDIFGEKYKWAYVEKDEGGKSILLGFGRKINQYGNTSEIKTPEKNLWVCLDKDGVDIGGVAGYTEEEAILNYVNCAVGGSIFDKPVCTLVKGKTRLNVSPFVVYVRLETGNLSGLNFMNKDKKDIPEVINIGLRLYQMNNYEGAINCYDWVLQWDSQNVGALNNKALALDSIGKYEEAKSLFYKALEIEPKNVHVLNSLSGSLYGHDEFETSLNFSDMALAIEPENSIAINGKGFALNKLGRHDEAIEKFNKILEIEPKNYVSLIGKGQTLEDLKKYDEALRYYEKAIQVDPKHNVAIIEKNRLLEKMGK